MKNKYNCISVASITKALFVVLLVILPNLLSAQQSASIQTGVTFQWSDEQTNGNLNLPATIQSITIDGVAYNTFVVPTSYEMTRLGPDGNSPNRIMLNGAFNGGNSGQANWNNNAIGAFQDKNLNHYFAANPNGRDICSNFEAALTTDAQKQTIFYSPAIPSNEGGVIAVTERGGNNCFYVEAWGIPVGGGPEQKLGETFIRNVGDYRGCDFGVPASGSDYWKSGRCNENGQTIGIGLFFLDDIAPTGSRITKIEFIGASRDHGDGKFFMLQKYAVDQENTNCKDSTFNGNLNVNNTLPDGSTYSVLSGPTPAGQSFILNTDGTYSYIANNGYIGDVTFEYQVCLPFPNETVCDTASASISFVSLPAVPQASISCGSTNDDFTISITSPIGAIGEFEYALNNGTYQSSPIFNNLTADSYTVSVISTFTNCENINSIPLVLENLELTGNITDVLCKLEATGAIDIAASGGTPPYTYAWSNSAITEDLSNILDGTYTVTVTDSNGCAISDVFIVDQPNEELASTITSTNILCNGDTTGTIDLTINGGTTPYTVQWNNGSIDQDQTDLGAGDYDVIITDANGCTSNNQITITESSPVSCQIIIDNCPSLIGPLCSDGDNGTIVSWNPPDFSYVCCSSTPGNDYSFNIEFDLPESASDCWEYNGVQRIGSNNLRLFQSNGDSVDFTTPISFFDTSSGVPIHSDFIIPNATIDWTLELLDNNTVVYTNTINNISSSGLQIITIPNTVPSGAYRLKFSFDDNGANLNASDSIELDRIYYDAVILDANCLDGVNFSVTSNYSPGDLFQNGDTTVIYTATYVDDNGDTEVLTCEFDVSVTDITLTENVVQHEDVTCNGENSGSLSIQSTGGTSPYQYSIDNGTTNQSSGVFENLVAGNYTVLVTDANNCSNSVNIVITQPSILEATITSISDIDCSGEATGDISIDVTGGTEPYTYSWSNSATSQNLTDVIAGVYTVTVTDANGCNTTNQATIIEPADKVSGSIIQVSNVECLNEITGSITAEGTGGIQPYSYSINNGTTTQSIGLFENLAAGSYTILISDANGCTFSINDTIATDDIESPEITVPATLTIEGCSTADINNANAVFIYSPAQSVDVRPTFASNTDYNVSDDSNIQNITYVDAITSTNACPITVLRTFTVIDNCDNTATATQTITVQDTEAPTLLLPANITIECTEDETSANTGEATATDNCGNVTITQSSTETDDCGNTKTITRTWTATDLCGNATSAIQIIIVEDTTPPTLTLPDDITIECGEDESSANTGQAIGEDTCGGVRISESDVVIPGCGNTKTIIRTWNVTDNCGNPTTGEQTITVEDTTPPRLVLPDDITIECGEDESSANTGLAKAEDNCGGVIISQSDFVTPGCGTTKTIIRTWTATDTCGNSTSGRQVITVQDSTPPTITIPDNITIECTEDESSANTGEASAIDTCGNVTITQSDNVTPACGNTKTIVRTWTATDDCGNTSSANQTITVQDTTPPTFDNNLPTDITLECDAIPAVDNITASDTCGDATVTLVESITEGSCTSQYTLIRTWTATDTCGNETDFIQTINLIDTTAPTFTVPEDITIECDVDVNDLSITGDVTDEIDNCATGLEATYSDSITDGNCVNAFVISRTWSLTDSCDNTTTLIQTINVTDTTPPTFTVPSDLTIDCDEDATDLTLTGDVTDEADNCASDLEAIYVDSVTDGNCANTFVISRTWSLTDTCDNTTTLIQTINVTDTTAPTFTIPEDITIECDVDATDLTLTGDVTDEADNCATDIEATYVDSVTEGACANEFEIRRTWSLADNCGNTTVLIQMITVKDSTPPTFDIDLPTELTLECDDLPGTDTVTATDNCGNATVTIIESIIEGNCNNQYTLIRTWTAIDDCENETVVTQTITVQDTTAPSFNEDLPADITVECDAVIEAKELTASDNCGTAEVTFVETITDGACAGDYIIERTWTATDVCGNDSIHTQIITVEDNTAPTLLTPFDENITIECNDVLPQVPELVFEDSCLNGSNANNINVEFQEVNGQINDFEDYQIIRTWEVTDDCANLAVFTQTITVEINNVINATDANRCIQDTEFDLFDLLSGDFDINGTWSVVSGNATIDGSFFDPASVEVGNYTFKYSITEGSCPTEVEVNVAINDDCIVLPCGEEDVIISKTVTANGDSYNEFFTISGVAECGFIIELQIFNRWGAQIYKSGNYQNDWNGDANGASAGNSSKVPTGTYYYIINLRNSGLEPFAGPIYVATNK